VDLRNFPELLAVSLSQHPGPELSQYAELPFGVNCGPEQNLLLRAFGAGWKATHSVDRTGDEYDDSVPLDPDALLAVRLAQTMRAAPKEATGSQGELPVYQPLCPAPLGQLREDFEVLLRAYAGSCPSGSLTDLLTALLSVELSTWFLCHAKTAVHLYETGVLDPVRPAEAGIFVNLAEGGSDLRRASEAAYESHIDLLNVICTFTWRSAGCIASRKSNRLRWEFPACRVNQEKTSGCCRLWRSIGWMIRSR